MKTLLNKVKDTFINKFWHSSKVKAIRSYCTLSIQKLKTPVIDDDETTIPYKAFLGWLLDIVSYGIVFYVMLLPVTVNPLWAISVSLFRWFTLDYKKEWKVT